MTEPAKYQVAPPLNSSERNMLKESINRFGILVPVEYDEDGNVLDGHHRVEIARELGIEGWPKVIRSGMSEHQKRTHARMLNLFRRHLDRHQRRQMIEDELKENAAQSDRALADTFKVDHKTVGAVREQLEAAGEISPAAKRAGLDGKSYRKPITQFIDDSPAGRRGTKLTAKAIMAEEREASGEKRRDLQRTLSDETANMPTGRKYAVIYADPATKFLAGLGPKSAENHYPTMTLDQLRALPVGDLALPDCRLYLWSTVPQLANSIDLGERWGFTYSSSAVWVKLENAEDRDIGPGYIFRNQHEILLVMKRGNPPMPELKPPSAYLERKREHSRKPSYYRELIAEMEGDVPRVELFARVDAEHPLPVGWDAWGNEALVAAE